jgi:hypothetical protein
MNNNNNNNNNKQSGEKREEDKDLNNSFSLFWFSTLTNTFAS